MHARHRNHGNSDMGQEQPWVLTQNDRPAWTRWLPKLTADRAWLVFFVPALISYLSMLRGHLNHKRTVGSVERLSPKLDALIDPAARIEVVAEGFAWAEGPLWVSDAAQSREYLLFSDVESNRLWKWEEGSGLFTLGKSVFLERSGCRSDAQRCARLKEPGSNGIARAPAVLTESEDDILLAMCEHGERRVAAMLPDGTKVPLATHYGGKRFNSPNDLVFAKNGDLYFTDPPYGLNDLEADSERDLDFNGVYQVRAAAIKKQLAAAAAAAKEGSRGGGKPQVEVGVEVEVEPELLEAGLTRPNGIAFSPRQDRLYIANSDRTDPHIRVYKVGKGGKLSEGTVFFDASALAATGRIGNPDGLKVHSSGHLFTTGPGGVLVLSPQGEHLGTILTGAKTGNVALGADGHLYIAADTAVLRIRLKPA